MVCHLDSNKTNNRAANLEWKTKEQLLQYHRRTPGYCSKTAVWQVDSRTGKRIAIFRTLTLAAKAVGRSKSKVGLCLAGKEACDGYMWQRASREDVDAHLLCGFN